MTPALFNDIFEQKNLYHSTACLTMSCGKECHIGNFLPGKPDVASRQHIYKVLKTICPTSSICRYEK